VGDADRNTERRGVMVRIRNVRGMFQSLQAAGGTFFKNRSRKLRPLPYHLRIRQHASSHILLLFIK
jgi:hypothetical protein